MNENSQTHYQSQTTYYQQLSQQPLEQLEAQAPIDWHVGDVILDLYEITALLGEGGMGKVFRARHRGWNIDLAVKCPKPELFTSQEGRDLYFNEAQTWIELGLHPHIASCYYVRSLGGAPRLFAECVEGGSLESWIENRRLYEGGKEKALERILDIAIQFAWGLAYAHERGLVHQDVKPGNVLMTPDGTVKVTDFGLANAIGKTGTPAFRSPEQAARQGLTLKTDIWSCAVSVLEMFTGGVTWQIPGQYAATFLEEYLERGSADAAVPAMPLALAELLQRCFSDDPADRPSDMLEIAGSLQDLYQAANGQPYSRDVPETVHLRADSLNNKALSMLDLGKDEEAIAAWEVALKTDTLHLESQYNVTLYQWRMSQMSDEDVITTLQSVTRNQPGNWRCHYLTAKAHMERGDYPAARACMLEASRLAPGEQEIIDLQKDLEKYNETGASRTFEGYKGTITSLAVSEQMNYALSGGADRVIRIWDLATGAPVRILKGHHDLINALEVTPDGRLAVSASDDNTVRVWDLNRGSCVHTLKGHKGPVASLAISNCGKYIISGSEDKTLKVWGIEKGRCLRTLEGHQHAVTCITLTPDGSRVISGSFPRGEIFTILSASAEKFEVGSPPRDDIRVWSLDTGKCLAASSESVRDIYALVVTPSGDQVVSCSKDGVLRLWGLSTGSCIRQFTGHTHEANDAAITKDGKWMVSASNDKSVRLWEMSTGECVRTFIGHHYGVGGVKLIDYDRRALSASADKTLRIWDLASGRCLRTFSGHTEDINAIALCSDQRMALSCSSDGTMRQWDLRRIGEVRAEWAVSLPRSAIEVSQATRAVQKEITAARSALAQNNPVLADEIIKRARSIPGFENDSCLLDLKHQAGLHGGCIVGLDSGVIIHELEEHEDQVYGLAITHDARFVLSGGVDKTLRWWDLENGQCLRTFTGHQGPVIAVAITPDEGFAVSASEDHTLRLWDLNNGECLHVFEGHADRVKSLSMTPDGLHFLSGDEAGSLRLWRLATGECLRVIQAHNFWVNSVAITNDGYFAVSGGHDKLMKLWRLTDGACLKVFSGHKEFVTAVALTPYVGYAISASFDKSLRMWNLSTGEFVREFKGHTYWPSTLAFTPDGRIVFSGALDRTIRVWDVASATSLYTIPTAFFGATCIALSQDGHLMIHAEEDGTLYVTNLEWQWEFVPPSDWNDGALPYLRIFLILHTPYFSGGPARTGNPTWTDEDFRLLIEELRYRGYGWLRPDAVRRKLEEMAKGR